MTNTSFMTKDGKQTLNLALLRSSLNGQVIAPEDNGYDAGRTTFYGGFDKRPLAIIRAADTTDVAYTVSLARQTGLELAIRGGGHSFAGHCISDGGLVLDLRNLRDLQIDPEQRTAWAGGGLTAGEYTTATGAYGLATGFGDTGSVGIGGITLGGGIGYLVRKYGLTIDNLLAAEIVTADGRVHLVDDENEPDLFWAIRGGGGNFGVVTRFQYRLQPVGSILGGMLFLPATPEILAGFMAAADAAPDELSTIANVMPAPPMPFIPQEVQGKLIIMAMMVYAGDPAAGEQVVAPFRALGQPIADMLRPTTYPEMFPHEEGGGDYHPTAEAHTMFMNDFDRQDAEAVVTYLQNSDAAMRVAQIRVLGGAMARVPAEATAFAHRQAKIMVNLAAFYNSPEERLVRQAWIREFAHALNQGDTSAYVNFLGDEGVARVRDAYPIATWNRLARIKAHYDPTNLFHMNHNIVPAAA